MAAPKNIDEKIVQEIRQLYETNLHTQAELAEQFGLTQSTVSKIVKYKIHKKDVSLTLKSDTKVHYIYGN